MRVSVRVGRGAQSRLGDARIALRIGIAPALVIAALVPLRGAGPPPPNRLVALTLNTKHGGEPPWSAADQIAEIAAAAPDVVFLQEARYQQLSTYVDALNRAMTTTAWRGDYARHCESGRAPACAAYADESVMILSRMAFDAAERHLIWARDGAWVARAVLRARITVGDGVAIEAFSCHLPADRKFAAARREWAAHFIAWAKRFPEPQLIGGDFNDGARSPAVAAMRRIYVDAFAARGSGRGGTETEDDRTYAKRFDYLFTAGALTVESAAVPRVKISDHRPLVAIYRIGQR